MVLRPITILLVATFAAAVVPVVSADAGECVSPPEDGSVAKDDDSGAIVEGLLYVWQTPGPGQNPETEIFVVTASSGESYEGQLIRVSCTIDLDCVLDWAGGGGTLPSCVILP